MRFATEGFNMFSIRNLIATAGIVCIGGLAVIAAPPAKKRGGNEAPPGFTALFNGRDFTNWKVPAGDNGHWRVVDGVIDYDASSESKDDKSLWGMKDYRDFVLQVDWRIKETPYTNPNVYYVLPD